MRMEEIVEETNGKHEKMVEITLKIIGPARPSRLHVPSSLRVHDLRKLIAGKNRLPVENLKLISQGKVLHDREDEDDIYIQLNDDSLIVAVKPKAPSGLDIDDDEEDLKFQLPQSTSRWKKKLYSFLLNRLKLPDILLMAIFSLSLKAWILVILWFILAHVAHKWDLGPLYILGTGFCTIFLNLGRRQPGDVSAYSIFNEDFRELPGTLNADAIDRDIRTGLYKKIWEASFSCPSWFSSGARNLIKRILDPNPLTRITIPEILQDEWFKKGYKPPKFEQDEDVNLDDIDAVFNDSTEHLVTERKEKPVSMNAFELISRSQSFSLDKLFEKQCGSVKPETSFASQRPPNEILSKIEEAAKPLGFNVHKRNYKMKLKGDKSGRKGQLSVATEVFEVAPSLHMVELRKTGGDTLEFHKFYKSFSSELKDIVWKSGETAEA